MPYGTAEAVPFVDSLFQPIEVSEGFMCWPNCQKSNRDKYADVLPGFLDECVEPEAAILIAGCAHCHPG